MGKPLKIILSILAGFVLLVVVVICSVLVFFNPNNYKPEIIAAVKDKTGRDLVIDGDLKLSFFPSLAVTTGKMTLSNKQGFTEKQFASLEESRINIELLPLLSKQVQVNNVVLNGLTVNLSKNEQGVSNWVDLAASKIPASAATSTPAQQAIVTATAFSIGGVTLNNAQINWHNAQAGKNLLFKNVNMTTDKAITNQPMAVNWSFVLEDVENKISDTVKLDTLLTVNEKLDSFVLSRSNLQVTITGENIPNKSITSSLIIADSTISLPEQRFKVSGLQLKAGDLALTADLSSEHFNLDGTVSLAEFSPTKLMKDFSIPVAPAMSNANAFNKLAISFAIKATPNSLDLQNLLLNIDDTTIKGATSINNFAKPAIAFDLAVDTLDTNRYLPPTDKNKQAASSMIAFTTGIAFLPIETLKNLNVYGEIVFGSLKLNTLNLQDTHFRINAKDGLVNAKQTIKQFYQGDYASNLTMDVRHEQAQLAIEQQLNHVQIEPLLTDMNNKATLRGTLDTSLELKGQGRTPAELQASLNGRLKFLCKDGALLGFSLQKMLDKGKALIKGSDLAVNHEHEETRFLSISGTANLDKGVVANDDLLIKTNKAEATGKGIANINTEQLDYKLSALLPKDPADTAEHDVLHNTPIVIKVGGTFSKPTYTLDVSAFLTNKAQEKIENAVNKLNTDENKAKIEHALDKLKPEEQEKVKKLAPKLGKLFKKLF